MRSIRRFKAWQSAVVLTPLMLWLLLAVSAVKAGPESGKGGLPPGVRPLQVPGVHNLFALSSNLFSGGAPKDGEAFAALAKLGVRTIITVDGAKPNVAAARRHGLRYVQLPHGYDGISAGVQAQLVKAAETLPGPIFVHCHHGNHRGPAAAAVIGMAESGWTPAQAEAWLLAAGTATNYSGLYEVVRRFEKPAPALLRALPSDFPETAKVSGLAETMAQIDERWDHLKAVRAADYKVPKDAPDLNPASEAAILWELLREARRLPESARHGAGFIDALKSAEDGVKAAEQLIRAFNTAPGPETQARLNWSFDQISKSCAECHQKHRDSPKSQGRP